MKKILTVFILTVLVFSLSACSTDMTKGKTAQEILEQSITKSAEWESYEMNLSTEMEMNIPEQGMVTTTMEGTGAVIMDPMKMRMILNIDMPQLGEPQSIEQYLIEEEEGFTIYQNIQNNWHKMVINDPSLVEMMSMDPVQNVELFMKYLKKAEITGEEVINDRDVVAVDLTVSFDMYKEFLENNQSMDIGNIVDSGIMDKLSGLGDLSYSIWIDKENLEIVKYHMDFSEAMQKIGAALVEDETVPGEVSDIFKDTKMDITMEILNQNAVEDFEIPEAAKNAKELSY